MAKRNCTDPKGRSIYFKLLDVIPDLLTLSDAGKSRASGYMDLGLDVLVRTPDCLVIALSHYYRHPSGDMIPDPDMEIAIFPKLEHAEAMTYQDSFGYRSVDCADGIKDLRVQRDLNVFLSYWLSNLIAQGHRISCCASDADAPTTPPDSERSSTNATAA